MKHIDKIRRIFTIFDMSRTTYHRRVACKVKLPKPSPAGQVVLEHAQKHSTCGKYIGFQPPVKNWWNVSDISVIFAIAGVAYFSVISYYNVNVAKTEDYLKYFLLALKIVYYLALIAFVHMIYTLIYFIYKKAKGEDGI